MGNENPTTPFLTVKERIKQIGTDVQKSVVWNIWTFRSLVWNSYKIFGPTSLNEIIHSLLYMLPSRLSLCYPSPFSGLYPINSVLRSARQGARVCQRGEPAWRPAPTCTHSKAQPSGHIPCKTPHREWDRKQL